MKALPIRFKILLVVRRIIVLLINTLFDHDSVFTLIGVLNRKLKVVGSAALIYPATEAYAYAYVFSGRIPRVRWKPWLVGFFWQDGKLGLLFVISANDVDFRDPENEENLRHVASRMEDIRQKLGAERKTFAGTLPGILYQRRIIREKHEAEVTSTAIVQAVDKVYTREGLPKETPVIVLGGRGFIGRHLVDKLKDRKVYSVDLATEEEGNGWPEHLTGQRAVLVNTTVNSALDQYLDKLWPDLVVVNEVYPEPSREARKRLKELGCRCYHIVGVKAFAVPSFPLAYKGGVPCCAAWASPDMEVRLLSVT